VATLFSTTSLFTVVSSSFTTTLRLTVSGTLFDTSQSWDCSLPTLLRGQHRKHQGSHTSVLRPGCCRARSTGTASTRCPSTQPHECRPAFLYIVVSPVPTFFLLCLSLCGFLRTAVDSRRERGNATNTLPSPIQAQRVGSDIYTTRAPPYHTLIPRTSCPYPFSPSSTTLPPVPFLTPSRLSPTSTTTRIAAVWCIKACCAETSDPLIGH
jgi:hypothetical protein